jgi:hypothetical protein
MPKEIVAGSAVPGTDDGFHVKVGWTADRSVQLGVETDQGHSLFWVLLGATVTAQHQTSESETQERERTRRRLAELGARVREAVESIPRGGPADAARYELAKVEARDDALAEAFPESDIGHLFADARVGEAVLNVMDEMTILEYTGVWADLSRDGCNRLIKIIRKARDAAYGPDE